MRRGFFVETKTPVKNRSILEKRLTVRFCSTSCFNFHLGLLLVELSCKSEYAILALLEMATHYENCEPMQIRQIALQQKIPDRYLEQLLATLRRGGIVKSQRGSKGGYLLAREPRKISIFEILECLEGLDVQTGEQNTNPTRLDNSVVSEIWQEARQAANSVLQNYSLQDLCEKRDSRKQLDIMYYI